MRLLAVTTRRAVEPMTGGDLRPFHLLAGLAERHEVVIVQHSVAGVTEAPLPPGVAERGVPFKSRRATLRTLTRFPTRTSLSSAYYGTPQIRRTMAEAVAELQPDCVLGIGTSIAPVVLEQEGTALAIDHVDAFSGHLDDSAGISRARFKWLMRKETHRLARLECEAIARTDLSFFTSRRDADATLASPYYRGGTPEVVPNGVDTEYFHPQTGRDSHDVVFVGDMRYPPNEQGVLWFAREILPLVAREVPTVRFVVVGVNPTAEVLALDDGTTVKVTGRVPDVRPYLWDAAVALAPMLRAGGIQNKVLEAMACGLPTVVTPNVVAGLEAQDGVHLAVGHDVAEFAARVIELLTDPDRREAMGSAARRQIEDTYTWSRIVDRLEDLLEGAVQKHHHNQ